MDLSQLTTPVLAIPGWATDHRIFSFMNCKLPPHTHFISSITCATPEDIKTYIQSHPNLTIVGFSLGALLALQTAIPHAPHIQQAHLISLRPYYPEEEINTLKVNLNKNKIVTQTAFYKAAFSRPEAWDQFKNTLYNDYINNISLEQLLMGLDILSSLKMPKAIPFPLNIYHGKDDQIAPLKNIKNTKINQENSPLQIFKNCGHIPFFP